MLCCRTKHCLCWTEQHPFLWSLVIQRVSKNVPPLACYNFNSHEWILIFFGRNVTNKVGNQKTFYYATSNNLCFCTTWQNAETRKSHFSLSWTVLHAQCTCALSSWKKKLSSVMCFIASDICWDSKISHLYCPLTFIPGLTKTTPIFYTATDSVTDMANTEHVGNTQQDAMLPSYVLYGAPSRSFWQWWVVQLWRGDILNCVSCFLVKKHAAFKWKDAISGFLVSPGSAEALVRCGGKIKYILIAYFLGNIYAKNCHSRTVYIKIIASQRWEVFWDTVYNPFHQLFSWWTIAVDFSFSNYSGREPLGISGRYFYRIDAYFVTQSTVSINWNS